MYVLISVILALVKIMLIILTAAFPLIVAIYIFYFVIKYKNKNSNDKDKEDFLGKIPKKSEDNIKNLFSKKNEFNLAEEDYGYVDYRKEAQDRKNLEKTIKEKEKVEKNLKESKEMKSFLEKEKNNEYESSFDFNKNDIVDMMIYKEIFDKPKSIRWVDLLF